MPVDRSDAASSLNSTPPPIDAVSARQLLSKSAGFRRTPSAYWSSTYRQGQPRVFECLCSRLNRQNLTHRTALEFGGREKLALLFDSLGKAQDFTFGRRWKMDQFNGDKSYLAMRCSVVKVKERSYRTFAEKFLTGLW